MKEVYIIIGGVPMTKKEFVSYKRSKNVELFNSLSKSKQCEIKRVKAAKKSSVNSYVALGSEIEDMVSKVRVMESLCSYYRNGFRMWGCIHRDIINEPSISVPYKSYLKQERAISDLVNEIVGIKGRSVFEYIRRLSWQLEDISSTMDSLRWAVGNSGVISHNIEHECINGEGKRLGLRVLMFRSISAISELKKMSVEFLRIADNEIV